MSDRYDLVIIGMGSGGMVGSEFAAQLGLRVAVVERHRVGGDCLWTGCVPSKALLASAKVAHHLRTASEFGLPSTGEPAIDRAAVWQRIRAIQDRIAESDDNPDRFRELGVDVIVGQGEVLGPHEVRVDGRVLQTRFILLCTGSRPVEPELPGLREAGSLTSETLFEIERPPASVVMVGGGPIAIEMAQGMRRLGMDVTVLQKGPGILPRDEPELVDVLQKQLAAEGVNLCLDVETQRVEHDGLRKTVHGTHAGAPASWSAEELLVAVGRRPNTEGLGLEGAGVRVGDRGVEVDDRMRTSVPSIYAAGDLAGRFLFTHSAGHEAVRAIRDMFFPGRGRVSSLVPWCTFTDPELAHAGATESEARETYGHKVTAHTFHLAHSDRARADGTDEGLIKVVVGPKGRLLGAHILSPAAGELIHEYALAINEGLKFTRLANLIHAYPTLSTSTGQLAAEVVFEEVRRLRKLVNVWKRLPGAMTRALVMGVLNVTPDSFSDGGRFLDFKAAVECGRAMVDQGADLIDVGGESTRPGAAEVPEAEELRRVVPVVEALAPIVRVSIDTTKSAVARAACGAGALVVNDVSAALGPVAGALGVGYVAMHRQGTPATMQADPRYDDVVAEVGEFSVARAQAALAAGASEVWIDPGIGFGKTIEHNLAILSGMRNLSDLGYPVMIGVSRKSFLGTLTRGHGSTVPGPDYRLEASLAAGLWAVERGASILRVHDVTATVQALRILSERVLR